MKIDGVRYVEAPEVKNDLCRGCAFESMLCDPQRHAAKVAFGGKCYDRHVIYIRAEDA